MSIGQLFCIDGVLKTSCCWFLLFKIVVHRRDQQVWGERYHRYRDFVFWTNNPLITFHISLWYFVSIRIQCHISFIDATNKPYVAMLNNTRGYQMIYDFTPHPMDNLMAVQVLFPIIQKQAVSWRKKCLLDIYSVLMVSSKPVAVDFLYS